MKNLDFKIGGVFKVKGTNNLGLFISVSKINRYEDIMIKLAIGSNVVEYSLIDLDFIGIDKNVVSSSDAVINQNYFISGVSSSLNIDLSIPYKLMRIDYYSDEKYLMKVIINKRPQTIWVSNISLNKTILVDGFNDSSLPSLLSDEDEIDVMTLIRVSQKALL